MKMTEESTRKFQNVFFLIRCSRSEEVFAPEVQKGERFNPPCTGPRETLDLFYNTRIPRSVL
jgi:hypothetical protein